MNTAQTTKNLAQKIAKQIAREPFEILKNIPEQVTGASYSQKDMAQSEGPQQTAVAHENQNIKVGRQMEALDRELKDISRERTFKELQRKISEGREVYLEEYPELSMEQKQVLKAQAEAVKIQTQNVKNQNNNALIEPIAKKGRRLFGFGQKAQAQKQQTRVEKPISSM